MAYLSRKSDQLETMLFGRSAIVFGHCCQCSRNFDALPHWRAAAAGILMSSFLVPPSTKRYWPLTPAWRVMPSR